MVGDAGDSLTPPPDVYFVGNMLCYAGDLVKKNERHVLMVIRLLAFHKTLSIVLLDLETFESHELKFSAD